MDSAREYEEEARDATPPIPTPEEQFRLAGLRPASSLAASNSSMERRKSVHRQSILYPAVTDFVPLGAIVQESATSLPSARSSAYPGTNGFGSKVQPSDTVIISGTSIGRMATGGPADPTGNAKMASKHAEMQTFPLRFRDAALDEIFCKHFNIYVVKKVGVASCIVMALNVVMLVPQYATHSGALSDYVFLSRVATVAIAMLFYTATFLDWFHRHFDRVLLGHYVLQGLILQLPRFFFLLGHMNEEEEFKADELALFSSQKSVRAMALLYILIVYIASGMRFTVASVCVLCHVVTKVFFVVAFCRVCTWDDFESTTTLAMVAFCTLTAYHSERNVRLEFVERMGVAEERKRRDDLLETMLPVHIKERLKSNRTDGLAEHYDEVSILFCYVSNFQVLSKHASAIELVRLMNRIVFCFDRATDVRGVYKVEAIAETYMCAAGVPFRDPFHCEKVAEMALTMMRICETERWSFNGVDIQLQIGIHSGPVVAGVVGCKTYSYHLFGDTVNTSSRVCSSGSPGRIQISERSYQLLSRTGAFIVSERGMMSLKGKGMARLFWLEGKYAIPSRSGRVLDTDVSGSFDAAVEESIRANGTGHSAALHNRSDDYLGYMDAMEISCYTLVFRCKHTRRRAVPQVKKARVQAVPNRSNGSATGHTHEHTRISEAGLDTQDVSDTATVMEAVFCTEHTRDSMPQFLMTLQTAAGYLLTVVLSRVYNADKEDPEAPTRNTTGYAVYGSTMGLLLVLVYLLRRYPRLWRTKERVATVTGLVFVVAMNLQLLFLANTAFNNAVPGAEQKLSYLDANLLHSVVFGLALRLRFRNAALVNASGYISYVLCATIRRNDTWAQLGENFLLLFVDTLLATYFGYRRELGLRRDFLLKCTLRLEKKKCEDLLTNMLPSTQYAEALMQQSTVVDELAEVTLLYSDMVGFTALGATLNPGAICVLLNQIYSAFDRHLDELGIYKMDTVGDAFIVVGGLPTHKSAKHHAAAITAFAVEMLHEIERFCAQTKVSLQMRIGIHTGKVVGGVVGIKKPRYLIWGHHTVVANLMESRGVPGRIQVSEDAYAQLRSCPEFRFDEAPSRVHMSESETITTYFLASSHPSVKNDVVTRYLLCSRPMATLNAHALAQLRNCLQPATNSPLSKQLEGGQITQPNANEHLPCVSKPGSSRSTLVRDRSFGDIIGNR